MASTALVMVLQRTMRDNAAATARLRANDVADALESGRSVSDLLDADDDVFVQVIDGSRNVVASSRAVAGIDPIAQPPSGGSIVVDGQPANEDDPFVVVARAVSTEDGALTVLVGRNLDVMREATWLVTRVLLVAVPLLMFVVALTSWRVVGRSLAPVEAMRSEVDEISASALHRRIPETAVDDEIARLGRTMNDMLARLEASRGRELRFISDASHELRNPIATIRSLVEVARAHPERTSIAELADEVLNEDLRLQELAEDLLLLARADEHALASDSKSMALDDLVTEEAERLNQSTTLRVDTSGVSAARTRGDTSQLKRVIRNLGDNAARHASTTVAFALAQQDGRVTLSVEDDGPGIPEESRASIFERFTRLDDARDRGRGGAGLGLAIVKEIVAAHGGRTTADSSSLGGARFVVDLPGED
jgi:signal transduction histidine kinase